MKTNKKLTLSLYLFLIATVMFCSCEDEYLNRKSETRTVSFNSMGGSEVPSQLVFLGTTIRKPENPTKHMAFFAGWFKEEECIHSFSYSMLIEADIVLYAKWTPAVIIRYETNGGSIIQNDTIPIGSTGLRPTDPSRDNSVFTGWFIDENYSKEFDFSITTVNKDITLYAQWIEGITLSFQTNASVSVQSVGVLPGEIPEEPQDPVVADSTFMGWYTDDTYSELYNFSVPMHTNTTVYAKWFQNIYTYSGYPSVGITQYYIITGLKPNFATSTTQIYIPQNIGGISVQKIANSAFKGNTLISGIQIEEGITDIIDYAFDGCVNVSQLNIPSTVIYLGTASFRNCKLFSGPLVLPDGLKTWGASSFRGCSALERVYLSKHFHMVATNSFNDCTNLKEVYIEAKIVDANTNEEKPITANLYMFDNCHTDLKIYVLPSLVEKYKVANNWSVYADKIKAIP